MWLNFIGRGENEESDSFTMNVEKRSRCVVLEQKRSLCVVLEQKNIMKSNKNQNEMEQTTEIKNPLKVLYNPICTFDFYETQFIHFSWYF